MSEASKRYNQGKLRWNLFDFKSAEETVKVLEFGANKYTSTIPLSIEDITKLCESAQTIRIERLSREGFADLVTTKHLNWQILNTKNVSDQTLLVGPPEIQDVLKSTRRLGSESTLRKKENEKSKQSIEQGYSESTELPQKSTSDLNLVDALFANQRHVYTLTTATPQGNLEVYCVVSATKVSGCLTMILDVLQSLSIISNDIYQKGDSVVIPGSDNWKKGLNREELLECAMRHLVKLFEGEEIDPESGLPHTGHINCNIMFYRYHRDNKSFVEKRSNPFKNEDK